MWTETRLALGAGLLSGLGLVLAFPPVSFWPAVLLIVWPLLALGDRLGRVGFGDGGETRRRVWPSALAAAVGTMPAWAWLTRWSAEGSVAGFVPLVGYLGLWAALIVWCVARVRRGFPRVPLWAAGPVLWVGVEFFRGRVAFEGFPWFLAAHPVIEFGAWPAAYLGTYFVSGLVALAAVLLIRRPAGRGRWAAIAVGLTVVAIWFGVGWWSGGSVAAGERDSGGASLRVGVVQTNVPQSIRSGWSTEDRWRDWRTLERLLVAAARPEAGRPPDVIVLPETMFPGFVLQEDAAQVEAAAGVAWSIDAEDGVAGSRVIRAETVRRLFLDLQETLGVPVLVGATRFENFRIERDGTMMLYEHDRRFNSVFLLKRGRVTDGAYDKRRLTPFGEVMPYISKWPWLEERLLAVGARGMAFDLEPGESLRVFEVNTSGGGVARLVAPICYEATVGDVCRTLVFGSGGDPSGRRAGVLVNVTNDGWFYDAGGGRELHLLMSRWRCVELATPMVRSANTGISAVVGADGRVADELPPFEAGVLVADVSPGDGGTPYARIGDLAGWLCLAGAIFWVGASYSGLSAARRGRGAGNRTETGRDDDKSGGAASSDAAAATVDAGEQR